MHFAIERLLDAPNGWRSVVRDMVARWPDAQASELIYVLVAAANEIEAMFSEGSPSRDAADRAWRLAALLGVDLFAMDVVGIPNSKAKDMAGYWKIDPYFRDL